MKARVKQFKFNRFLAWFDMIIKDHGFLRFCYNNFHKVDENLYRSNMPTPSRIRDYRKLGIKTIVNLRGVRKDGGWLLENEACGKYNIKLIDFRARSRAAPEKEMIFKAEKLFNSIKYPALIHCKSGADRAGFVAAIYLMVFEGKSVQEAQKQLSIRFFHLDFTATGILDYVLWVFEERCKVSEIDFREWINSEYDPELIQSCFNKRRHLQETLDLLAKRGQSEIS